MSKILGFACAAILVLGVIGAGVYISRAGDTQPARGAIVVDLSDSRIRDCNSASVMARDMAASLKMSKGSKIYLFGTGDELTADEPVLLGSFDVQRSNRALEGKKKTERAEAETFDGLKSRCDEAPQKKRSPIFLTLKRVVEHLRANGCDGKAPCAMYVQTDGQELSENTVKKALADSRANNGEIKQLPTRIDNSGIAIRICGFAQVHHAPKKSGKVRNASQADQQREVWRQLFTDPKSVIIEPHCSQAVRLNRSYPATK